ncbi:MAG: D-glucuronyl C5-epimerase family protein [Arachnia sp.]
MSRFTPLRLFLATALTATLALVMQPTTPAAAVDIYTEPGRHSVNGREWYTTCGQYSSTVRRCSTDIWATQVTREGDRFVQSTGWFFNNLTYLPAPRADWAGNRLSFSNEWTENGRQWRTECDTPETGQNGCRSYIFAATTGVVSENPRTYGRIDQWVFNNMMRFTVPTAPPDACSDLPIPSGFAVSVVNGKKIPHAIKIPYSPNTRYNPTSISNFTRSALRNTTLKKEDREKWDCLVDIGTSALMDGSDVETYDGKTVRWFPYMFEFDASGTGEIPALEPGWRSGLAQGAALGVMAELATATGDNSWLDVGEEVLNSFDVPLTDGGFLNREDDFLWFEEYPTTPPTTVLNGHLEAIIGLDLWERKTGSQKARDLFNEAIGDLEANLPLQEVEVEGGILTSYDLVRGYDAAPLRLTKVAGKGARLDSARMNGVKVNLPLTQATSPSQSNILSPVLALTETGSAVEDKWRSIAGPSSSVVAVGGAARIKSSVASWQGIQQIVPRETFTPSSALTMTLDAKLTLSEGPGLSGRVAVYQKCDVGGASLLFETQKPRGRDWDTYTMGFTAPPSGCDIWVQLLHSSYGKTGTTVEYRNINLRAADTKGTSFSPSAVAVNDLSIRATPTVPLLLTGAGTARLEAYSEGQWQEIDVVQLTSGGTTIEVPERFTGRNLHYGYHETHVYELLSLYSRAMQAGFSPADAEFLRSFAERWEPMAPARHGSIPAPLTTSPQARMAQQGPDLDTYELPLVDPFQLLMEE